MVSLLFLRQFAKPFFCLNINVLLSFHTWKYCPSNLVIWLTSTLLLWVIFQLWLKFNLIWLKNSSVLLGICQCWSGTWFGHGEDYIFQCKKKLSSMCTFIEINLKLKNIWLDKCTWTIWFIKFSLTLIRSHTLFDSLILTPLLLMNLWPSLIRLWYHAGFTNT